MTNPQTLISADQLAATNKAHHSNESPDYRAARNQLLIEEINLTANLNT